MLNEDLMPRGFYIRESLGGNFQALVRGSDLFRPSQGRDSVVGLPARPAEPIRHGVLANRNAIGLQMQEQELLSKAVSHASTAEGAGNEAVSTGKKQGEDEVEPRCAGHGPGDGRVDQCRKDVPCG